MISQVQHQILFVLLTRIKKKQTLQSWEKTYSRTSKTLGNGKEDTRPDIEKASPKETTPLFPNKVNYEGDNNEKTHGSHYTTSEPDGCVINLA